MAAEATRGRQSVPQRQVIHHSCSCAAHCRSDVHDHCRCSQAACTKAQCHPVPSARQLDRVSGNLVSHKLNIVVTQRDCSTVFRHEQIHVREGTKREDAKGACLCRFRPIVSGPHNVGTTSPSPDGNAPASFKSHQMQPHTADQRSPP